jgi:hypothetical protein
MRIRVFLVAPLAAAVLMAGCGGGGGTKKVGTATTVSGSSNTVDSAAVAAGLSLAPADCRAALEAFASSPAASLTGGSSKVDFKQVLDNLKKVQAAAPSEIKADLAVIVEFYGKYVSVFADNGIDLSKPETMTPEKAQKLASAFQGLDQAKLATASQHISAYFQTHCQTG